MCNSQLGPGTQLSTFKERTVGPPDSWAPDRCRSPTSDMIFVKYFTHIRQIRNIARGTTDPGYWVHNSNHPPWQITFWLREIRGYKNKKYYFLSFVKIPKSKKEINESRPCRQCRLNNQHASAVGMIWVMDSIPWVRCASGNVYKTQEVVFLIFVSHISCNQNCISFYPQNSYNFALTIS